jgi:hypothetical protein
MFKTMLTFKRSPADCHLYNDMFKTRLTFKRSPTDCYLYNDMFNTRFNKKLIILEKLKKSYSSPL